MGSYSFKHVGRQKLLSWKFIKYTQVFKKILSPHGGFWKFLNILWNTSSVQILFNTESWYYIFINSNWCRSNYFEYDLQKFQRSCEIPILYFWKNLLLLWPFFKFENLIWRTNLVTFTKIKIFSLKLLLCTGRYKRIIHYLVLKNW